MNVIHERPLIIWLNGWASTDLIWEPLQQQLVQMEHQNLNIADFFRSAAGDLQQVILFASQAIEQRVQSAMNLTLEYAQDPQLAKRRKVVIVGWSLGASVAIRAINALSRDARQWLDGLAIISGTLQFCSDDGKMGWPRRILERMQRQLMHSNETAEQTILSFFERAGLPDDQRIIAKSSVEQWGIEGLNLGLQALMEWDMNSEFMDLQRQSKESFQLFWGHGRADFICPPAVQSLVRKNEIRSLCCKLWENQGHTPFLQSPKMVAEDLITCFFGGLDAPLR